MFLKHIYEAVYPSIKKKPTNTMFPNFMAFVGLGGFLGWQFGFRQADQQDYEQYLTQFIQEDDLYYISDRDKKPILILYYIPGDRYFIQFRQSFLRSAKKYKNQCHFIMINCAKHYNYCKNIEMKNIPKAEIMLPKRLITMKDGTKDEIYPLIQYNRDFSELGVEGFLEDLKIIPKIDGTERLRRFVEKLYQKPVSISPTNK